MGSRFSKISNMQVNFMAGHRCPIIHRLNLKAGVIVKNGQLKAIKAALRLSRCHVHTLIFEVGFYLLLIYKHKIVHYGRPYLFGTPVVSHHKVQLSTTPIMLNEGLQVLDKIAASNIFTFNLHGATLCVAGPQETATHTSKNKCKVPTLGVPRGPLASYIYLYPKLGWHWVMKCYSSPLVPSPYTNATNHAHQHHDWYHMTYGDLVSPRRYSFHTRFEKPTKN